MLFYDGGDNVLVVVVVDVGKGGGEGEGVGRDESGDRKHRSAIDKSCVGLHPLFTNSALWAELV